MCHHDREIMAPGVASPKAGLGVQGTRLAPSPIMTNGTTRMAVKDMDLDQAREEYRRIRARAWQCATKEEFDTKVGELVTKDGGEDQGAREVARARAFVRFARLVRFTCRRCAGTGQFITYVENGTPKGPGGICYRCEGKGWQDDTDARRNYGADIHQRVF